MSNVVPLLAFTIYVHTSSRVGPNTKWAFAKTVKTCVEVLPSSLKMHRLHKRLYEMPFSYRCTGNIRLGDIAISSTYGEDGVIKGGNVDVLTVRSEGNAL